MANPVIADDSEMRAVAFSGPAPLANRIAVHSNTTGVRIAFAEQYDPDHASEFRSAVFLSEYQAWELWRLLGSLRGVQEAEMAFLEAEAESESEGEQFEGE